MNKSSISKAKLELLGANYTDAGGKKLRYTKAFKVIKTGAAELDSPYYDFFLVIKAISYDLVSCTATITYNIEYYVAAPSADANGTEYQITPYKEAYSLVMSGMTDLSANVLKSKEF